jgi:hypothetical protein
VLKAYLGEQLHAARDRKAPLEAGGGRLLATERLSAGYGALDVIRGIDLDVEKGELVAVLGNARPAGNWVSAAVPFFADSDVARSKYSLIPSTI